MPIVAGIGCAGTLGELVQGRHGKKQVVLVDEFRHLAMEKGDEQAGDVGPVDIGIGHDNHLVVAQVAISIAGPYAAAERLDKIGKLLVLGQLVPAGARHI